MILSDSQLGSSLYKPEMERIKFMETGYSKIRNQGSSMKAMTAPRRARSAAPESHFFLDHKQVYFFIFALCFVYYILAVAS